MSGFSADWLRLREPADHRARNAAVLAAAAHHLASRAQAHIVDLGCGAGSNLRATAPSLPVSAQSWTLVDYDPALLDAARARLAEWADAAEPRGEELLLRKDDRTITVDFRRIDLHADLETVLGWQPDLVTAAAFFDLVSAQWIERLVTGMARRKLALYTVLTFDGRHAWTPPHSADAVVDAAFHAHQGRDKGFGPAAGPKAAGRLAQAFAQADYAVVSGDSPWRLAPPRDAVLIQALADGIGQAARETGQVEEATLSAWRAAHGPDAGFLVGHQDLFAAPRD